jgi:hypothetical protein
MMAFGEGSTWISISETGEAKCSHDLEQLYPKLLQKYNMSILGSPRLVVLGSEGYYFVQHENQARWNLPASILDEVDMHREYHQICVLALGMSGSYVIQLSDGTLFWNLKGHYRNFMEKIVEAEQTTFANVYFLVSLSLK